VRHNDFKFALYDILIVLFTETSCSGTAMNFRKVRVFYNRRSGVGGQSLPRIQEAFSSFWREKTEDLAWYFPADEAESDSMLSAALNDGADCVIVCGGDGTVSSIGTKLIGTNVCLGVVPTGSGNGLARHFAQSLNPSAAIERLASGSIRNMDVGYVNDSPFLVSASAAWDAALVKAYNMSPMRGLGSYVIAGIYTFFEFSPKPVRIIVDNSETIDIDRPLLLTIGNLSGWGFGALIDKEADGCDGRMELVAANQKDAPLLLAKIAEVFTRGVMNLPNVIYRKIRHVRIERAEAQHIQLDGELREGSKNLEISVRPAALRILVPSPPATS
jgi:diacylglycerol kinase (ATP)